MITQYGCKDSINKVIQSFPIPISNFSTSVASGTPPLPISFTNTSSGGSYFWDFGDGNISTAVNPLHTYTDTGTFSPSLIVVSDKGCRDSSDKTIYTFYPYRDLSIENLSFTKVNNVWKITCLLKNTGNIKIENCRLAIALQGKSPVYENASFSIEQGSLLNYTSSTEFLASDSENPGFLCIQIISLDNEADENESNNEKCTGNSSTFNISNLYPVPAVDYLQIGIGIPEAGNIQLGVWDITGRSIQIERTEQVNQGYNRKSISLAGISSGVYILKIVYNNKEISRRFIKQ